MDDLFLRLSLKCRSWYCTFSWNLLFSPLDFILSLLPLSLLKYFSPLLFSLQSLSFEEQCFCSSWVSLPYFLLKYQSPLVSSYLTSFLCLALKILKENDNINCQSLVQSPVQVEGLGLSLWSLLPIPTLNTLDNPYQPIPTLNNPIPTAQHHHHKLFKMKKMTFLTS